MRLFLFCDDVHVRFGRKREITRKLTWLRKNVKNLLCQEIRRKRTAGGESRLNFIGHVYQGYLYWRNSEKIFDDEQKNRKIFKKNRFRCGKMALEVSILGCRTILSFSKCSHGSCASNGVSIFILR